MQFPERMLLKLPAGTLGRIDEVSKNRNEWIRDLVLRSLEGVPDTGPVDKMAKSRKQVDEVRKKAELKKPSPMSKRVGSEKPGRWDADKALVLDAVRGGCVTVRRVAERLGWMDARADRVCGLLLDDGVISMAGGVIEVSDV